MKKLALLPFAVLCVLNVAAQGTIELRNATTAAVIAPNTVINMATQPVTNFKFTFDLKNTSSTTQTYTAKRYDILLNTANSVDYPIAKAYFCFAGNCYNELTYVSPNDLVLTGGQSASQVQGQYQMLVADLDECDDVGQSIVRYTFKNINNSADSVQVTIDYNNPVWVSVKEHAKSTLGFRLTPNPSANGLVNIKSEANFGRVEVINQLGAVVMSKTLGGLTDRTELDLSAAAAGVYYVRVYSGDKTNTQKLVITGR